MKYDPTNEENEEGVNYNDLYYIISHTSNNYNNKDNDNDGGNKKNKK